jgi:hypothetical protein
MAVSLGYGIVFATVVVLLLIPCLYMIVEDLRGLVFPPQPDQDQPAPPRPATRPVAAE